jgi:hypothetical protein
MSQVMNFQVNGVRQPFDALGLMVYLRTYARRLNEEDVDSPVENWAQCLTRCVNACNTQLNCGFTQEEAQDFFDLLHARKCSFAGRFLWQLGTKTVDRLGLMSLQNCAFCKIDNFKSFTWLMNFLMLGAGVGYRITQEDVDHFPPIKTAKIVRQDNKDADFILGDHRGAWIQLLGKVLKAHFYSGKGFTYSTQLLRGKNEVIKGFGGVSSGGQVLCDGMAKISAILNQRALSDNPRLTTVDALDIANIIGMIVVSGNVRRSAQIACGSFDDVEFLRAKRWDLGVLPNWRCYSNNSVLCDDINEIIDNKEFWHAYEGNGGECLGLINMKLARSCGRIGDTQYPDPKAVCVNPCVSGDTWVMTDSGAKQVRDLALSEFQTKRKLFIDGKLYSMSERGFFMTSVSETVYKIKTVKGFEVEVTGNHRIMTTNRGWVEAKNLNILTDCIVLHHHKDITWNGIGDWVDGIALGELFGGLTCPEDSIVADEGLWQPNYLEEYLVIDGKTISKQMEHGSYEFYLGFLSGLFNTAGQFSSNSICMENQNPENLVIIQRMLHRCGIMSEIVNKNIIFIENVETFAQKIRIFASDKYENLSRLVAYNRRDNKEVVFSSFIQSIVVDTKKRPVYDCTVPEVGKFDANGLVVSNCSEQNLANFETCCLGEIFLPNIQSFEELKKCVTYVYRSCKHSLTLPCVDSKETEDIVHEHMRMGIGMSGILQASDEQRSWLSPCYEYLRQYDKEYSTRHNFPPSIKLTTVKPSGCSRRDSLVLTTDGLMRLDELGDVKGDTWQAVNNVQAFTDQHRTEMVTKFYVNGNVETRKIVTLDGVELESSLNHRYRVFDRNLGYIWKRVDELKKDDNLVVKLGGCADTDLKRDGLNDAGLAGLLGAMYSKAPIMSLENKMIGFIIPVFKLSSVDFYEKITKVIKKHFPESYNVLSSIPPSVEGDVLVENKNCTFVFCPALYKWCENATNGFDFTTIPKLIRTASASSIREFLSVFFKTLDDKRNYALKSEIVQLCRAVNYNLGEYINEYKPRFWNGYWLDPIVSITPSRCDTFDIEVENAHHYRLGGVISHNTLSLLGHVSPGIHPAYSRYLIRRIRVSTESKLIKLAKDHGYPVEFVKNFDGTLDYGTSVISFPYQYPEGTVVAKDLTAIQQLEWVKYIQTQWSDNAVSVTVYYKKEELPAIKQWLKENYNMYVKSVSFLLHSGHGFVQAPLEEITKEEYDELCKMCKPIEDIGDICHMEKDDAFIGEGECAGGACPLK